MKRLRAYYGQRPLRLLAAVFSFAVIAAGLIRRFQPGSDPWGILPSSPDRDARVADTTAIDGDRRPQSDAGPQPETRDPAGRDRDELPRVGEPAPVSPAGREPIGRLSAYYQQRPLRLLAAIVSFALIAAGIIRWFEPGSDPRGILLWFLAGAVGFELVLVPLAWVLDRIAFGLGRGGPARHAPGGASAYVRVPALLSGLLLLVFLPLIFRLGQGSFEDTTAIIPSGYLARWLFATAAMFGCSALAYAIRLGRARRRPPAAYAPIGSDGQY